MTSLPNNSGGPPSAPARPKRVQFYTLGCKLNFAETSTLARQFADGGFVRAGRGEPADICVINTCSVTGQADSKCRNVVRRAVRENPGALVAVTGCYAQLKPGELADIQGVDLVIGNNDKGDLFQQVRNVLQHRAAHTGVEVHGCGGEEISNFFAAFSVADRTRAFLKVQDGCDYRCAYCTIPLARGASRNIPIAQLVDQAREIARGGTREIVLTGVNVGDFGHTTGERFVDLLGALDAVEGIERYRISSIEPNLLTDEVITFCRDSRAFVPHFHIPLQAGDDRVLGLMRRRYTTTAFAQRIERVRAALPDAFIGVDVIVGFPGETTEDFEATRALLKAVRPSQLHVFPYSVRPGTPAAQMPDRVPPPVAAERAAALGALSEELHAEFTARFEGTTAQVLWEAGTTTPDQDTQKKSSGRLMSGFTGNYLRITAPYDPTLVGTIAEIELRVKS